MSLYQGICLNQKLKELSLRSNLIVCGSGFPECFACTYCYVPLPVVVCISSFLFLQGEHVPCTTGNAACLFQDICHWHWAAETAVCHDIHSPLKVRNLRMNISCGCSTLETSRPLSLSNAPYSWMVILLFKDVESYVDLEAVYAPGRYVLIWNLGFEFI
jgi:hypothetical protein